jgi:hypothetical protein
MLAAGQQRATSVAATNASDSPGDMQSAAPATTPGAASTETTPRTKAKEALREYREKYGDQEAMDLLKSLHGSC